MDQSVCDAFRLQLLTQAKELAREERLGAEAQRVVALDQQSVGRLSRMDALQQQAMARATGQRRKAVQSAITAALMRLDSGEFGYCLNCGDDIALERLRLNPAIPNCITCARG